MKQCIDCKKTQPEENFNKSSYSKDGLHYYCRKCKSKRFRKEYAKHKQDYLRRCVRWRKTEKGQTSLRKTYVEQRAKSPEKYKARTLLNAAVLSGKVVKPYCCATCKKPRKLAAHHPDYSKPLEVIWLCYPCHTKLHKTL